MSIGVVCPYKLGLKALLFSRYSEILDLADDGQHSDGVFYVKRMIRVVSTNQTAPLFFEEHLVQKVGLVEELIDRDAIFCVPTFDNRYDGILALSLIRGN